MPPSMSCLNVVCAMQHSGDVSAGNRRDPANRFRRPRVDHRDDKCRRQHPLTDWQPSRPGEHRRHTSPSREGERKYTTSLSTTVAICVTSTPDADALANATISEQQDDAHDIVDDRGTEDRRAFT